MLQFGAVYQDRSFRIVPPDHLDPALLQQVVDQYQTVVECLLRGLIFKGAREFIWPRELQQLADQHADAVIVDLVGDAGGDFADRSQLLGYHQLLGGGFQPLVGLVQLTCAFLYAVVQFVRLSAQPAVAVLNLLQQVVQMR